VLATGGAGQCFAVTTNPGLSTGDGIALALRAGVACADVEFVQFHPTALHHDTFPRPLLSEALRGEGAVLRDSRGSAFMSSVHPMADLAPRDIVSLAIARRMRESGDDHVWLDTTMIEHFSERFPTIWGLCRDAGLDPSGEWLPVAPAAHYLSGGVVADLDGATTLPGLWACGEVACSGVHGANRLASNSLLEGLVFGERVVSAISVGRDGARETGAMRGVAEALASACSCDLAEGLSAHVSSCVGARDAASLRSSIQRIMSRDAGVERDATGLTSAAETLAALDPGSPVRSPSTEAEWEVSNIAQVARAIVAAALAREESRGSHARSDFPAASALFMGRLVAAGRAEPVLVPLNAAATQGGVR